MMDENDVTRGLVGKYVDTYAFADGRSTITVNKRLGDVLPRMQFSKSDHPREERGQIALSLSYASVSNAGSNDPRSPQLEEQYMQA